MEKRIHEEYLYVNNFTTEIKFFKLKMSTIL